MLTDLFLWENGRRHYNSGEKYSSRQAVIALLGLSATIKGEKGFTSNHSHETVIALVNTNLSTLGRIFFNRTESYYWSTIQLDHLSTLTFLPSSHVEFNFDFAYLWTHDVITASDDILQQNNCPIQFGGNSSNTSIIFKNDSYVNYLYSDRVKNCDVKFLSQHTVSSDKGSRITEHLSSPSTSICFCDQNGSCINYDKIKNISTLV